MALLSEIGTRLSDSTLASSSGKNSWTLIESYLPDSTALPDKIVALLQTGGPPPDAYTEVDRPGFQVLVRGESLNAASSGYDDAEQESQDIKADLHAITPGSLSGRHYVGIWADGDPFLLEYDQSMRPVIATNYTALRSRT